MSPIPCECGCGTMIPPINKLGKPAHYKRGHQPGGEASRFTPGHKLGEATRFKPGQPGWKLGTKTPPEETAKRIATRRAHYGGDYFPDGKTLTDYRDPEVWHQRLLESRATVDQHGERNPFHGKTHTLEAREKMGVRGEDHPAWKGGMLVAGIYSPDFTKKFRRLIRERDQHTCQRCGAAWTRGTKTFHVHHVDFSKTNNDPANLITLCLSCHSFVHSQERDRHRRAVHQLEE